MRAHYDHVKWLAFDRFDGTGNVFRFRIGTLSPVITVLLRQDARGLWQSTCTHGNLTIDLMMTIYREGHKSDPDAKEMRNCLKSPFLGFF